jgi:EAL domain-containing protein (putative c-di-GMP-specific phosphodiesterase class I)/GGDEF domain-containing protein
MLLSQKKERQRRFALALRAALPILMLVGLIFYTMFLRGNNINLSLENKVLIGAIVFISVYFVYFLIDLSAKETLIDQQSQGYNQKAFVEQVLKTKPPTLALITIDNLTTIYENYSYNDIDILIFSFANKLNNKFKIFNDNSAIIARRYGAEFLIGSSLDSNQVKDVLKSFISKNSTINAIELDLKFAVISNTTNDIENTINHLKDIINTQKVNKKSTPIYDAKDISQIEKDIIDALHYKRFNLLFRPIQNIKTGSIDIYELSVKLTQQNKEILPKTFLPIINRLGLGREYDMILFEKVLAILPLLDEHICISFNISPFSLRDEKFQSDFFEKLHRCNINPSRIIIELYERKTHHNLGRYLEILKKFRAKGIKIAIDNFGSSNASMEYMKHFRFDLVQFDRDFVTNIEDSNTQAMLKSLVDMSKSMNITTVAKWVDNQSKKQALAKLGIEYIQGFGVGKPINEKELIEKYN